MTTSKTNQNSNIINKINIGLSENARLAVSASLNRILATEMVLANQARSFHWNVTGRNFANDHALFGEDYDLLTPLVDDIAERQRSLGTKTASSYKDCLELSSITEAPSSHLSSRDMMAHHRDAHEAMVCLLRKSIEEIAPLNDEGTSDFLIGLMETHEKRAWFFRAHLEE